MSSSRITFFRQSGWMVVATTASGVFMFAANIIAGRRMEDSEWTVFRTMLSIFLLMSLPATGLQIVFTQQTAATHTEEEHRGLAGAVRAVLAGTFVLWLMAFTVVFIFREVLLQSFKINNSGALWITAMLGVSSLWLPILRGLLQGAQHFAGLGTIAIVDGVVRCGGVALVVSLGGQAAGGLSGALAGQIAALGIGFWLTRTLWLGAKAPFAWKPWFQRVVPLTVAFSPMLMMTCADVIYVQKLFPTAQSKYYMYAQIIGVALLYFTTPLAAVMFPKIVASTKRAQRSDALPLALGTTALILGVAALAGTLFPELPLRILFFSTPDSWKAATLVPWFAWALLPLILANVLVSNLVARERFEIAPWLALVAFGYGCALFFWREQLPGMEMFHAFKTVIGTLGGFSWLLLAVAFIFTRREMRANERANFKTPGTNGG